ncbi:MAG: hypothetical protein O7F76_13710, partial [Planctomycetota bacterium]|nr:hypothetical protein [Planctomycetota bacterium]
MNFVTPLYAHYSESEMWYRYQPDDIVLTGIWKTELTVNGYRFCEPGAGPTFQDYFEDPGQYEPWLEKNEPRYRPRWDGHAKELRRLADLTREGMAETTGAAELARSTGVVEFRRRRCSADQCDQEYVARKVARHSE